MSRTMSASTLEWFKKRNTFTDEQRAAFMAERMYNYIHLWELIRDRDWVDITELTDIIRPMVKYDETQRRYDLRYVRRILYAFRAAGLLELKTRDSRGLKATAVRAIGVTL